MLAPSVVRVPSWPRIEAVCLGGTPMGVHVADGGVAHLVGVVLAGLGAVFGGLFGGDARGFEQCAEGAAEVGGSVGVPAVGAPIRAGRVRWWVG
jgi:hypothetical protein